jgi:hypothetical protein
VNSKMRHFGLSMKFLPEFPDSFGKGGGERAKFTFMCLEMGGKGR